MQQLEFLRQSSSSFLEWFGVVLREFDSQLIFTVKLLTNCTKPFEKRRERLTKGFRLLHDNARPYTSNQREDWLQKHNWEVIAHPLHSLELAPSDFHLLGPLKAH
ncbi:hypothetical protein Trydic_g1596 [Trypoxylus dichotomus]